MGYIDADKLIAEIERYIKHYEKLNRDEFKNGELYICQELLSFIKSLQQEQPSLPSNVDEAAFAYGNRDGITAAQSHAMSIDFKAGAEWMAGRGQTFEAHVDNGCAIASGVKLPFVLWDTYEDGDVLKVQIRKK